MLALAIETSCDETSVAVIKMNKNNNEINILSNIVSSQVEIHAKWGGVVPNLAAREHLKNIIPVLDSALKKTNKDISNLDLIAVTRGPGLIPALLIGTNMAKTLSYFHKKPLIGVHHVEGHIAANFIFDKNKKKDLEFPALALVVSGGHTQLIFMNKIFDYEIVGQTQDDAVGEAFDKVAKMLDLGYPGGPIVSRKADQYLQDIKKITNNKLKEKLEEICFPRPLLASKDLNFSFSGLKTAVLYFYKGLQEKQNFKENVVLYKNAICYQFQKATTEVLVKKTIEATKKYHPKTILIAGGVAANKSLQKQLEIAVKEKFESTTYLAPKLDLCGDNAAMIGAAALLRYQKLKKLKKEKQLDNNWKDLEADSNMKLNSL
ncbi:MAG: tRNA (adenosine(37)-N6)-threonylcarbamoyltransferase complex transferase subunit TsaD [Patescibacteria group bacterium]|nr:tRNA (adenosine(37)-N6)-threonylcarbamoyltransferase complex transferase subunit TsaD [Patescibacteria group bacterium]